jgi:protein-disulfide isomerase
MDEIESTPPPESETPKQPLQSAIETAPEPVSDTAPAPAKVVRRVARPRPPVDTTVPMEFFLLMLPIVFVLGLGAGWLLWGGSAAAPATANANDVTRYEVVEAGNPAIGPEDAPVKIIEFSDYQCPYCKRWYDTVKARLLADYEGRIRFVYRDLPLSSIHPEAQSAAEAANCAGEQNAYWPYHDALFSAKYGLSPDAYIQYASELGLDVNSFSTCVAERRYQEEVNNDASVGTSMGLNGTPTFFVNGLKVVGSQPYEVFQQIIDNELKIIEEAKKQ